MSDVLRVNTKRNEPLLSEAQAVEYLGLQNRPNPEGSLRWLMRTRKIAYVKLARGIYGFRRNDLDEYIEQNVVPSAQGR